jgi:hypothetical protein
MYNGMSLFLSKSTLYKPNKARFLEQIKLILFVDKSLKLF